MIKKSISKFKEEFDKSVQTAIVAAFGFLIALSWKDLITQYVNKVSLYNPFQGQLISTLIVTAISVIGIIIVNRVFSPKKEEEKK